MTCGDCFYYREKSIETEMLGEIMRTSECECMYTLVIKVRKNDKKCAVFVFKDEEGRKVLNKVW